MDEYKASKKEKENLATIEQFTTVRRQNSSWGGERKPELEKNMRKNY